MFFAPTARLTAGSRRGIIARQEVAGIDQTPPSSVVRMSNEGVPHTQTVNSSDGEFAPFLTCYQEKAAPIWGACCQAEPAGLQCRR